MEKLKAIHSTPWHIISAIELQPFSIHKLITYGVYLYSKVHVVPKCQYAEQYAVFDPIHQSKLHLFIMTSQAK